VRIQTEASNWERTVLVFLRLPVLALFFLGTTLLLSTAHALAAESTENYARFGPDGTETSNFQQIRSVALDQETGDVYVLDSAAGTLYKFEADGTPLPWSGTASYITGNAINGLEPWVGPNESQVAVDSTTHIVYVTEKQGIRAFQANGDPALFTAGASAGTNLLLTAGETVGIAVDSTGALYVSEYAGEVTIFSAGGEEVTSFSTFSSADNLAVGPDGTVYVGGCGEFGNALCSFTPSSGPLEAGTTYSSHPSPFFEQSGVFVEGVGADPATGHVFVLVSDFRTGWIIEVDAAGQVLRALGAPAPPANEGAYGLNPQGIAILAEGEEFQFYFGNNDPIKSTFKVEIFGEEVIEGPPAIGSTSAIDVTSTSATLRAQINPNTADTTYYFEYGLSDCGTGGCTRAPVAGATILAGHRPVPVIQGISGLQPSTVYHYRIVAENSFDKTEGSDRTFTTQGVGLGFSLADRRVWEMVSPPRKFGGTIRTSSAGVIRAAEKGDGLVYLTLGSIEADPEGNRSIEPSNVLAHRDPAGTWSSEDISLPHARASDFGAGSEFDIFSPDLAHALVEPRDELALSPEASERTPYLRTNSAPPAYKPLVTSKDGFANVPAGTEFGSGGTVSSATIQGASPDLSHVVLVSEVPLTADAARNSLYEWANGQLAPVSALPAEEGGKVVQGMLGSGYASVRNAVSDDGSRVFWSRGAVDTSGISTAGLYVHDSVRGTTRLDTPKPGAAEAGPAHPAFQGATADGSVVFFTDSRQLTADASTEGRDLYRCVIPTADSTQGCATLEDISAGPAPTSESANVLGLVPALSSNGSRAYFVADRVLDTAPNQRGETAVPGQPNLYIWESDSAPRFIASLSFRDDRDWGKVEGATPGYASNLSAGSSGSGRYFAFMSERSLTGYDNLDAVTAQKTEEVFVYDAAAESLSCVSCSPTGGSPHGDESVPFAVDYQGQWQGRSVAAIVPQPTDSMGPQLTRYPAAQPRYVLDNGRVFFNASDALVPADSNGNWDVYQSEPAGTGDCSVSSGGSAVVRSGNACLSVLSSGDAQGPAIFLEASSAGNDVFFLSLASLSPFDQDSEADIYDARVDGVSASLPLGSECLGEACQPAPKTSSRITPASSTYRRGGNASGSKVCRKLARRAKQTRGRARALRRKGGRRADARKLAKANELSRKADALAKQAKRCKRAHERAGR
jgi:hypothetical protein